MTRQPRTLVLPLLALFALAALPAAAETPDWSALADVQTLEVVTTNEDGTPRETTIWLAVLDGQGYLRTGDTRWGDNVVRNPEVTLRTGTTELPLRVELVEDEALRERVAQAFRDKYGFSDSFISIFRFGRPKIMRLVPR